MPLQYQPANVHILVDDNSRVDHVITQKQTARKLFYTTKSWVIFKVTRVI